MVLLDVALRSVHAYISNVEFLYNAVRCAMRAAATLQRKIRCFAIEKNANAVVTLLDMRLRNGWKDQVEIVHTDMRFWVRVFMRLLPLDNLFE